MSTDTDKRQAPVEQEADLNEALKGFVLEPQSFAKRMSAAVDMDMPD
ncbi:MAG: hypothetical protein ACOYUZ_04645 [Patescibacteria group bacterium]